MCDLFYVKENEESNYKSNEPKTVKQVELKQNKTYHFVNT